ncbi:MAG TPA: HEAT repeat domain-containing protein [Vicinamibacterales bacterium]|nr:HEAT repeat domain-containing protein [Vicinamibacterales bacterium]
MSLFSFLALETLGEPAAMLLIADAVIKATLLLSLAGLVAAVLRRSSAATRHLVWTLGLMCALAVPALSLAVPRWQLPIVTVERAVPEPRLDAGRSVPANAPAPRQSRHQSSPLRDGDAPGRSMPGAPSPAPPAGTPLLSNVSWPAVLGAVWLAGALLIVGRLAVGLLAVQWMSRRTEVVTDARWLPLARELAAEVGVSPRLTFLRSARATMPMAWGLLKPSVLMPADADGWPVSRLRIVLLHELAHVKRRDCLTHALAQLACAVHWFNPLAWVAARRLRTERERACDDLVLAAGTRGSDYADQLLDIARVMRAGRFPVVIMGATLAMAHQSQLEGRLIAILDPKVPRAGLSRLRAALATVTAACAVLPFAAVQPWAYGTPLQPAPEPTAVVGPPAIAPQAQPAAQPQTGSRPPAPDPQQAPGPAIPEAAVPGATQAAVQAAVQGAVQGVVQGAAQGALQGVQGAIASLADLDIEVEQDKATSKTDPKMIAALTAALKDVDREVREAAMHALVQLRDPAIFEPLVAALKDTSADVREAAASGLAQLRDRRAVQPLAGALKDENAGVREQAAFALGQLRDPASIDALIGALKDQNPNVREQAAFALGQIRDPRSVDGLLSALKDANANVREQAAFALGQIRDKRAVAALAAAMSDSSASVREQAVFALGQIRDASAVDGLMTALHDTNPDVRQQAAFALGQLRDRRAVEPLISALKDADADVREQAAFGLGQIRDRSAVEALVIALKDSDASVREQVAFALGQIRDPRAIDPLTNALKDSSASVRQQAAFALGQLAR